MKYGEHSENEAGEDQRQRNAAISGQMELMTMDVDGAADEHKRREEEEKRGRKWKMIGRGQGEGNIA